MISYERRPIDYGANTNGMNFILAPFEYTSRCTGLSVAPDYYRHTLAYGQTNTVMSYQRAGTNQVYVYAYGTNGLLSEVAGPGNTGRRVYGYDTNHNITSVREYGEEAGEYVEGRVDYDARSLPLRVAVGYRAAAEQAALSLTWDGQYQVPTSLTDASGNRLEIEYERGQPVLFREWAGAGQSNETRVGYTSNGLPCAVTNANGHVLAVEYDGQGNLKRVSPQAGPAVDYQFTALGHLQQVTLGGGRTVALDPDEVGRVRTVSYPDGTQEHYGVDAMGAVTNVVDPLGRVTRLTYAPTHKLNGIIQVLEGDTPQEVRTTLGYDNQFNTLRIRDALDREVESYQLDLQDRPVSITNVEGQVMTVSYGVGDMVKSVRRFDGSVVSNRYDTLGRVVEVLYPDEVLGIGYQSNGLPVSVSNAAGTLNFAYDGANRLTNAVGVGPGAAVGIGYYPAGQVSNVTTVAGTVTYQNDAAERLACLDSPQGRFTYFYNPTNGLVESVRYPGGMRGTYTFDVMDRVSAIEWQDANSNLIRSVAYGYDAAGMITNMTRESGESAGYRYDSLYRLTGESQFDAESNVVHSAHWNYDLVGNRTQAVVNGVTNGCTLGQGNRLATFGTEGVVCQDAAGCVTSLVYDASRRLDLKWDSRYQVTEISTNGTAAEQYAYDVGGRRVMTVYGGVTNWHVYDGAQVVADLDAAGGMIRSYVWGAPSTGSGQAGIDNLLALTVYGGTTNTYYALKDHLGSVHALVDTNGVVVEQYRYTAWGETTVLDANGNALATSAYGNRYLWQGREYSWATGLYNFRARWYDPVSGRWLSNDPIGISGGLNQYVAFANNPVNFRDPSGLDIIPLSQEQLATLNTAIDQMAQAGYPQLAQNLAQKAAAGEIVFNTDLSSDVIGYVNKFWNSKYIQLNKSYYPSDSCDQNMSTLKEAMAHEYIHTLQFQNFPNKVFWATLNGLSIPFYTAPQQVGSWLGGGGFNTEMFYFNQPSEATAYKLSAPFAK